MELSTALCPPSIKFSVSYNHILLSADLSEALTTPSTQDPLFSLVASSVGSQRPSLGLLVQHLRECVDSFMSTQDSHLKLLEKKDLPGPLSSEDIRQVVNLDFIYRVYIISLDVRTLTQ